MWIDVVASMVILNACSAQDPLRNYFGSCDYYVRLNANEGTSVINPGGYVSIFGYFGYLGFFDPGTACRYFIECPQNYVIRLYCYLNIAVTVNGANWYYSNRTDVIFVSFGIFWLKGEGNACKTEQFRVLDDGTNHLMERGTYFCGQGGVTIQSRTNFIAFGMQTDVNLWNFVNWLRKSQRKNNWLQLSRVKES